MEQQTLFKHPQSKKFKINEKIYIIRSFTNKSVHYEINATRKICSCKSFLKSKKKNFLCKHLKKHFRIDQHAGFSPSLLKSAIQKAIRRAEVYRAVKAAKLLARKKPSDLLRRLPVIAIEDALLLPNFPRLADLAAKSSRKDFVLCKDDENFVLSVVEQSARCKYRDVEFLNYTMKKNYNYPISDKNRLSEKEKDLVDSINFRARLGGMKSDIVMLRISAKLWQHRFSKNKFSIRKLKNLFPRLEMDYSKISLDEKEDDILLEAVDFHCSPLIRILMRKKYVIELIKKEYGNITTMEVEKKLKHIIWRVRSGINFKSCIILKKQFDWLGSEANECGVFDSKKDKVKFIRMFEKIRDEVDSISRWYINTQLRN